MVAQNAEKGNCEQPLSVERQLPEVHAQLDALVGWVCRSAQDGTSAHQFERGLFDKLLALGKTLFQSFLKLVGPGDFGESVTLDDGRLVQPLPKGAALAPAVDGVRRVPGITLGLCSTRQDEV